MDAVLKARAGAVQGPDVLEASFLCSSSHWQMFAGGDVQQSFSCCSSFALGCPQDGHAAAGLWGVVHPS